MKTIRQFFACLAAGMLIVSVASFPVFSSTSATITGRVTDQQGLVVPGAQVQATKILTNISYAGETNEDGLYRIANLPPGEYRVIVQKDGFASIAKPGVELHVQDIITLNFSMQVGSVTQTITVEGGAPLVGTESATVSTVVDRQFVGNLPLNGRSFQTLIHLTPGTVFTHSNPSDQGQFSVNGQRANANYFSVDGVSANIGVSSSSSPGQAGSGTIPGLSVFGGTNNLVSVDALEEFRVLTSTFAPEFGRTPGAQVLLLTRSGTNEFHGTLFEYFRNDVFDANDWFSNMRGLRKAALRQNDFGGVLGGPIIKSRTFFFFSYEGLSLRLPQTATADVPSLAVRQAAPPAVQPYLNAFPVPNGPITGGFAEFTGSFSNPSSLDATSIRIDHALNSKIRLFGRYNYAPSSSEERGPFRASLSEVDRFSITTQTLTAGVTYTPTGSFSNDLRFNYSRNRARLLLTLDDFGGAVPPPDSVLFPPFASSEDGLSSYFLLGSGGSRHVAINKGKNTSPLEEQINVVDGLSIVRGSHQLKFGIDYRRFSSLIDLRSYFLFFTLQVPTAALAGTTTSGSVTGFQGPVNPVYHNISVYAQDTWKATPKLALTYGLRWEVNPPPSDNNGGDPLVVIGLNNLATATPAPPGTALWETRYRSFAPRVGAAYQLVDHSGRELVVRGGFGIFYDLGSGPSSTAFSSVFPFSVSRALGSLPIPLPPSSIAPPVFGGPPSSRDMGMAFESNLKLPVVYQWNVALEQSLGSMQAVSLSYVAAVGRRLLRQEITTVANPNLPGFLFVSRNAATSDYHGLQVQYQRRLSHGLQALASYTWSHSIDIASQDVMIVSTPPATLFPVGLDRGPSDFDVRQSVSGALTYDIPSPRLKSATRHMLSNWTVDTIFVARSATPLNITYQTVTPVGFQHLRPDKVPSVPTHISDPAVPGGRRINPSAFSIPTTLAQGTLGRNALRGFGVWQLDLAFGRRFNLTERLNLRFKAELFNIFNHPNFGDPGSDARASSSLGTKSGTLFFPNPTFGISPSTLARSLGGGGQNGGFSSLYQVGGQRSIQLSLKLSF